MLRGSRRWILLVIVAVVVIGWGNSVASAEDAVYRETPDGRTYGLLSTSDDRADPDLFKVIGDDGKVGYAETDEVFSDPPADPAEAVRDQLENDRRYEAGERIDHTVPVFKSDGATEIDSFDVLLSPPDSIRQD